MGRRYIAHPKDFSGRNCHSLFSALPIRDRSEESPVLDTPKCTAQDIEKPEEN
jgi:hypothetical protein